MIIGLALIYFLLAVLVSALNEFAGAVFSTRAKALEVAINNLLQGKDSTDVELAKDIAARFYEHPLIKALHTPRWFQNQNLKKPSYIPARLFRSAVEDILVPASAAAGPRSLQAIRQSIAALPDSKAKLALLTLVMESGDDLAEARASIERWFDDSMDRVSGWYKRQAQLFILVISLLVATSLNADTFSMTNHLANNPEVRAFLVAQAEQVARQTPAPGAPETGVPSFDKVRAALSQVEDLQIPLGWPKGLAEITDLWQQQPGHLLLKLIGLLVTAVAVSLGAPFWFDLVNKLLSVRSTGAPPRKTEATEA